MTTSLTLDPRLSTPPHRRRLLALLVAAAIGAPAFAADYDTPQVYTPWSGNPVSELDGARFQVDAGSAAVTVQGMSFAIVDSQIRNAGSGNARHALLFRDYLRSNPEVRDHWSHFKQRLAESVPDIFEYGQIKQPATCVVFAAAEQWAQRTGWTPDGAR